MQAERVAPTEVFVFPLTLAQERLRRLERFDPQSTGYCWSAGIRIEGKLDTDALELALHEIVRRHEALRTTFAEHEGSWVQVVASSVPCGLEIQHVESLPPKQEFAGIDLQNGPLFRACLFRRTAGDGCLVLLTHHLVFDGWSFSVLLRELGQLYARIRRGEPPGLPGPKRQYGDFALWQASPEGRKLVEADTEFWVAKLKAPVEPLPLPYVDGAQRAKGALRIGSLVAAADLAALKDVARAAKATLFAVLLAAWNAMVARSSGLNDLYVFTSVAGRYWRELEESIGFYSNAVVLRTDASGDPALTELAARERDAVTEALAHQMAPFDRILLAMQPARPGSVMQVMFNLFAVPVPFAESTELRASVVDVNPPRTRFDLTITAIETGGGLQLWWDHNPGVMDTGAIAEIADHYSGILRTMMIFPHMRIAELPSIAALAPRPQCRTGRDDARTGDAVTQEVARLFGDLLGIGTVAAGADFFLLGGHSLLAVQVLSRIGDRYGVSIPLSGFFAAPTPAGLAGIIAGFPESRTARGHIPRLPRKN